MSFKAFPADFNPSRTICGSTISNWSCNFFLFLGSLVALICSFKEFIAFLLSLSLFFFATLFCLSFSSFAFKFLSICFFLASDCALYLIASASYCFFFLVVAFLSSFIFFLVSLAFFGFLSPYCCLKAIILFTTFLAWYPVSAPSFLNSFLTPTANCLLSSHLLATQAFPLSHKLSAVTSLLASITPTWSSSILILLVLPSLALFKISSWANSPATVAFNWPSSFAFPFPSFKSSEIFHSLATKALVSPSSTFSLINILFVVLS